MAGKPDLELEEAFAQRRMSRDIFWRLTSYLKPYRVVFILNLVFTLLATASQLLGPKFIQIGVDRYLTHWTNATEAYRGILIVSGLYLVNLLLGWTLSVAQVKSAIRVGQGAMNDLRMAVFEHIQRLSLNYFDKTHQGRIIARADTDIDSLDRIMTWGANQMLSSLLTLVGVVMLMLQYDWRLCLAVSVVLPPLFVATRIFHAYGLRAHRKVRAQTSRLTAAMAENIAGVRVVQAFSRESENLERFQQLHETHNQLALAAARVFHTYMPFLGLMAGVGSVIILGYGGTLVMKGEITVGELAAFVLYLGMFFGPIQTMGDLYNAVLSTAASAERVFQLLDTPPQVRDQPGAEPLPGIRGHVVFEDVWFRYDTTPRETWVLKHITFEAKPGETVALVGHTGSGKTSIISLIARFYEPQRGRVLMDGIDLQVATVESLHQQIGIVTQENFLFTGTVLENLKFGRPGATDEEVMEAARTLGTHELILRFAEGYQTKVGERGGNFSAGERQLLTFTRAMVARPRVLILDEATSAVDAQTEQTIQHALERLFARRTCFVVAHRLSTVRHAHRILVLSQGEIIEQGTHQQLLAAGGHYARLHDEFVRE
ncbi:MAG TPA: ABC transporter ATP-binding protein [Verrucomicrobiae bacterium]|nr:ABC transporter ATP-binding protein [Verrucomicrobiae bacterium]